MRIIAREEDRDVRASAVRRERDGIKAGDRPEPVVISSRSIRTPTREKRCPQLTRIRVEPPLGRRERNARGGLHARSRYADGREKERGKCLGRGKGSRGGEEGNGVNLEESRGSLRALLILAPLLASLSFFHLSRAECLGS